jgi:hypothetical protein
MTWLAATVERAGVRTALRVRPWAELQKRRPGLATLAVVTHQLERVGSQGLPEPSYNDELADLDAQVIAALESLGGSVVLIDTSAGQRRYFSYCASREAAEAAFQRLAQIHDHHLSCRSQVDSEWAALEQYRADVPW